MSHLEIGWNEKRVPGAIFAELPMLKVWRKKGCHDKQGGKVRWGVERPKKRRRAEGRVLPKSHTSRAREEALPKITGKI